MYRRHFKFPAAKIMSEEKSPLGIKYWAEEDRPREKLMLKGKSALSDAELIAILISSGNDTESAVGLSRRILEASQNNLLELSKMGVSELKKFRGIGEAKALSIIAALELGRRRQRSAAIERPTVFNSQQAYDYIQASLSDLAHEEFLVLYLNRGHKVLGHEVISRGGVAGTVADVKLIIKSAVDKLASFLIVAHNHPSGNTQPSPMDTRVTKQLQDACRLLDLNLDDHLIIGQNSYFSFRENGLL